MAEGTGQTPSPTQNREDTKGETKAVAKDELHSELLNEWHRDGRLFMQEEKTKFAVYIT